MRLGVSGAVLVVLLIGCAPCSQLGACGTDCARGNPVACKRATAMEFDRGQDCDPTVENYDSSRCTQPYAGQSSEEAALSWYDSACRGGEKQACSNAVDLRTQLHGEPTLKEARIRVKIEQRKRVEEERRIAEQEQRRHADEEAEAKRQQVAREQHHDEAQQEANSADDPEMRDARQYLEDALEHDRLLDAEAFLEKAKRGLSNDDLKSLHDRVECLRRGTVARDRYHVNLASKPRTVALPTATPVYPGPSSESAPLYTAFGGVTVTQLAVVGEWIAIGDLPADRAPAWSDVHGWVRSSATISEARWKRIQAAEEARAQADAKRQRAAQERADREALRGEGKYVEGLVRQGVPRLVARQFLAEVGDSVLRAMAERSLRVMAICEMIVPSGSAVYGGIGVQDQSGRPCAFYLQQGASAGNVDRLVRGSGCDPERLASILGLSVGDIREVMRVSGLCHF